VQCIDIEGRLEYAAPTRTFADDSNPCVLCPPCMKCDTYGPGGRLIAPFPAAGTPYLLLSDDSGLIVFFFKKAIGVERMHRLFMHAIPPMRVLAVRKCVVRVMKDHFVLYARMDLVDLIRLANVRSSCHSISFLLILMSFPFHSFFFLPLFISIHPFPFLHPILANLQINVHLFSLWNNCYNNCLLSCSTGRSFSCCYLLSHHRQPTQIKAFNLAKNLTQLHSNHRIAWMCVPSHLQFHLASNPISCLLPITCCSVFRFHWPAVAADVAHVISASTLAASQSHFYACVLRRLDHYEKMVLYLLMAGVIVGPGLIIFSVRYGGRLLRRCFRKLLGRRKHMVLLNLMMTISESFLILLVEIRGSYQRRR